MWADPCLKYFYFVLSQLNTGTYQNQVTIVNKTVADANSVHFFTERCGDPAGVVESV